MTSMGKVPECVERDDGVKGKRIRAQGTLLLLPRAMSKEEENSSSNGWGLQRLGGGTCSKLPPIIIPLNCKGAPCACGDLRVRSCF